MHYQLREKGGGKKGGGGGGSNRSPSRPPSTSRGASLDPERESLKTFNEVWSREGKHPDTGTAKICLWFHSKNNCNRNPCPYSHDPKLKLPDNEKKACAYELGVRFPTAKGKAKSKATPKAGGRSATPRAKELDSKGNEKCIKFKNGNCNKGDQCSYSHAD